MVLRHHALGRGPYPVGYGQTHRFVASANRSLTGLEFTLVTATTTYTETFVVWFGANHNLRKRREYLHTQRDTDGAGRHEDQRASGRTLQHGRNDLDRSE